MADETPEPRGLTRRGLIAALVLPGAASACRGPSDDPLPDAALPGVPGLTRYGWAVPGIVPGQFRGRVTLLNVWASWCPYCRGEHGLLMELARDRRFALVGIVFKDAPDKALAYLQQAGNPYDAVALDPERVLTARLRQRGVPSTYVVDRSARVVVQVPGALSRQSVDAVIMPAVRDALAAGRAA